MVVAIDGPAGVGKSTVSKRCAERLGFLYVNSGNIYRAVTRLHIDAMRDPKDNDSVVQTAQESVLHLTDSGIIANGKNITHLLHTDDVDAWVAQHSAIIPVRNIVNDLLRKATVGLDIVVEGRDITTVVFPEAEMKIYLDATIEVRSRRRFEQRTSELTLADLQENIAMRDKIDTSKSEGSLKIAADARYIDTSRLTIEEVCEKVIAFIHSTSST